MTNTEETIPEAKDARSSAARCDAGALRSLEVFSMMSLLEYCSSHDRVDVLSPGYFDPARDRLRPGDMILVGVHDGSTSIIPRNSRQDDEWPNFSDRFWLAVLRVGKHVTVEVAG